MKLLQFQWVLRTENWEWVVPVTVPKQNLHHGLPLPQCVVTKQRLKDVADDAGKRNSMDGVEVVCRYEGAAAANGCTKVNKSLLVTDVAKFFWRVTWAEGRNRQVATSQVRGSDALRPKRGLPLPEGWATALRAFDAGAGVEVTKRLQPELSPGIGLAFPK